MKNEELYLRIRKQRSNKENRDIIPFSNFTRKTERSERLLNLIEHRIKDRVSLKEARIQFVISDVTAFEVYFKDLFQASYLFYLCQKDFLDKCEKIVEKKFEFQELITIIFGGYELADIVMEHQNFQNLNSINKVFSIIIKENFLDSLNGRDFVISEKDKTPPFKLDENWYVKLERYLKLRHDLIHDYNPKLKLTPEEILELHVNLIDVIIAIDIVFIEEIFRPNVLEAKKKKTKSKKPSPKESQCIFASKKAACLQHATK